MEDVEQRFWSKVKILECECWEWTAAIINGGYGQFNYKGHHILAHRFAYEWFVGEIPKGLQIDHLCRNRWCVNPAHMDIVTNKENAQRGELGFVTAQRQRGKTHCPHGHPYSEENTYTHSNGDRVCRICNRGSG